MRLVIFTFLCIIRQINIILKTLQTIPQTLTYFSLFLELLKPLENGKNSWNVTQTWLHHISRAMFWENQLFIQMFFIQITFFCVWPSQGRKLIITERTKYILCSQVFCSMTYPTSWYKIWMAALKEFWPAIVNFLNNLAGLSRSFTHFFAGKFQSLCIIAPAEQKQTYKLNENISCETMAQFLLRTVKQSR